MTEHEIRHVNTMLRRALWWALAAGVFVLVTMTLLISGPEIERRLFPVNYGMQVLDARAEGRDLVISGTLIKGRHCEYVPPPIARAEGGQNLYVESLSPTAATSWPASDEPQRFGPWRVRDGAGRKLVFYQLHECHVLWSTFSRIGAFDARGLQ